MAQCKITVILGLLLISILPVIPCYAEPVPFRVYIAPTSEFAVNELGLMREVALNFTPGFFMEKYGLAVEVTFGSVENFSERLSWVEFLTVRDSHIEGYDFVLVVSKSDIPVEMEEALGYIIGGFAWREGKCGFATVPFFFSILILGEYGFKSIVHEMSHGVFYHYYSEYDATHLEAWLNVYKIEIEQFILEVRTIRIWQKIGLTLTYDEADRLIDGDVIMGEDLRIIEGRILH